MFYSTIPSGIDYNRFRSQQAPKNKGKVFRLKDNSDSATVSLVMLYNRR